jgi:ssDNA-binding Zn-finger/Zn-ribbon topoisomerase 1
MITDEELLSIQSMLENILTWDLYGDLIIEDEIKNLVSICERELKARKPPIYENVKCPECNGPMVSRTGKFGTFWGCKSFPQCKGTRDSQGRSKSEREAEKESQSSRTYEHEQGFPFSKR